MQSLILLEDIDAAFPDHFAINKQSQPQESRRKRFPDQQSDITFSGLLNVLDGVAAR